jgi:hypothetical protein
VREYGTKQQPNVFIYDHAEIRTKIINIFCVWWIARWIVNWPTVSRESKSNFLGLERQVLIDNPIDRLQAAFLFFEQ